MSNPMAQLQEATIKAQCKTLRMPMVASQFGTLAEQAIREEQSHIGYLEALLLAEIEERERNTIERRIRAAHLPRMKTLEEFAYTKAPNVTAAKMRDLAEGGYIERAEPVLFIGECGTGKTHLLTGLCVAACQQKRRVRFTTAAGLVNELVEAKHKLELRRVMARWSRYDLIAIDEVGYVPLAEVGAEFLFQVVAERAERAAVVLTTNLPFSEWTQVIPNARLCKALLDRITDRAHILDYNAIGVDLDVGGFQISMRDALFVRGFKCARDLACDAHGFFERHRPFGGVSLDILHHEVIRADIVNLANMG